MRKIPGLKTVLVITFLLLVLNFFMVGFPGAIEFIFVGMGWLVEIVLGELTYEDSMAEIIVIYGFIWPFWLLISYAIAMSIPVPDLKTLTPIKYRMLIFFPMLFTLSILTAGIIYYKYK